MSLFRFLAPAALGLAFATPLAAQTNVLDFSLTGGARIAPSYFGSSNSKVSPAFNFGFTRFRFGDFEFGEADGPIQFTPGAGLRGAFRYIPKREGKNELAGMNDVNAALEVGLGAQYTTQTWQVYTDLRYGVIGHKGVAGEVGANLIYRAQSGLVLNAGPRAEFGNSRFTNTYFGVTNAESLASGLGAFNASGGIYSLGFEVGAYQPLNADWGITGTVRYDRLRGDAAHSPITLQGSRDQVSAEIGLTRHFNLRF